MSYSTLYRIYRTKASPIKEFRNGSGTGRVLWMHMSTRFLGRALTLFDEMQPVWDLSLNPAVPHAFRLTCEWTFDRWVCPPTLREAMAAACAEVGEDIARAYPTWVNHWPALAETLAAERDFNDRRLIGFGLGCTSVCDPWSPDAWRPATDPIYLIEPSVLPDPGTHPGDGRSV